MVENVYNFLLLKGATFRLPILWEETEGTPKDLTGYTARMDIRTQIEDEDRVLRIDSTSGITITPEEGKVELYISPAQTTEFPGTTLYYDLELVDDSGDVDRILQGIITLSPEVTRETD